MSLDPDDPRPPYQQVASALRAAILTKKLSEGDKLPSQNELASRYGVARMTIQQALRILKDEGLTVSRQGSGVFVRSRASRPVGIHPHVEAAFRAEAVRIDFAGFTSETLYGLVREPLDLIRSGRLSPRSIAIRLLLVDTDAELAIPAPTDSSDAQPLRTRMAGAIERYAGALRAEVEELADLGLIDSGEVQIRTQPSAPMMKLYLLNESEAFSGFYPVTVRKIRISEAEVDAYDVLGKDTALFHQAIGTDPDSAEAQYVDAARQWFDSVWTTIARPMAL